MALSSAANRVDYTGNGSTSVYSYTFYISADTDLVVTKATTAGVETTLTLTTDYTVTGVGAAAGGSITLVAGNLTSGYHLTIRRVKSVTQPADIRNQGEFFPETHEDAFDRSTMVDQQQQEQIDRCVKNPITIPTSTFNPTLPAGITGANVYLRTNSTGTAWEIASAIGAGQMYFYPTATILGNVAPTGLPAGSGAIGYDSNYGDGWAIGVWIPALSIWRVIASGSN